MTLVGRVVRVDADGCTVRVGGGERRVPVRPVPAVGDEVVLDGDGTRLVEVRPRRNEVVRADGRRRQVLAANVDDVFVVVPLDVPDALGDDVERQLALALASGAAAALVLTKRDVAPVPDLSRRLPGVEVVATSAVTGDGVEDLRRRLGGRTGVLLGPSGAGKSTLVNLVAGAPVLETGATRAGGDGRHTTIVRRLIELPGGGALIDIPGLRSLGMAAATAGVERLFADLEELAATCRFADCGHVGEPRCALADAVARGALDAERVARWQRLHREAASSGPPPRRRRRR